MKRTSLFSILAAAFALIAAADVVQFTNGDRFTGKVLLVNETEVRVTNEVTGLLTVPRAKVASIQFGTAQEIAARPVLPSRSAPAQVQADAATIEKVQREFLGAATPEANEMFDEMVQGLLSGKLNVGDIRLKAQETLNEVRQLQTDLGEDDTAGLLNSYVSILETFLKNTGTNTPAPTGNLKKGSPAADGGKSAD